jgi:hypothetical protein
MVLPLAGCQLAVLWLSLLARPTLPDPLPLAGCPTPLFTPYL